MTPNVSKAAEETALSTANLGYNNNSNIHIIGELWQFKLFCEMHWSSVTKARPAFIYYFSKCTKLFCTKVFSKILKYEVLFIFQMLNPHRSKPKQAYDSLINYLETCYIWNDLYRDEPLINESRKSSDHDYWKYLSAASIAITFR